MMASRFHPGCRFGWGLFGGKDVREKNRHALCAEPKGRAVRLAVVRLRELESVIEILIRKQIKVLCLMCRQHTVHGCGW